MDIILCRSASAAPLKAMLPCWISRFGLRAEFAALFIHDAFTTNDNYILLQIVEMLYALNEVFDIKGMFRHKDDIRTSVGRSECDIAGMPTHHLDDGDSTMALGCCPDPFDATDCHLHARDLSTPA